MYVFFYLFLYPFGLMLLFTSHSVEFYVNSVPDYRLTRTNCTSAKSEDTSRDSHQFNGKVERKIAVVTRRVKATLNATKLLDHYLKKLWGEAIMFVTDVENMLLS
jgi:hypothetical protein